MLDGRRHQQLTRNLSFGKVKSWQRRRGRGRPVLDLIPARPPGGIGYEVWATLTSN